MYQINLTAYQTVSGQSFTSDSEKQIPIQPGQSARAVESKYTDSNGGKTVPFDLLLIKRNKGIEPCFSDEIYGKLILKDRQLRSL